MVFHSERLDLEKHQVGDFSCGEESLDPWLREEAARVVVVDALNERAAGFYESLGFRRIPDSLRLIQKVADIEAALRPS